MRNIEKNSSSLYLGLLTGGVALFLGACFLRPQSPDIYPALPPPPPHEQPAYPYEDEGRYEDPGPPERYSDPYWPEHKAPPHHAPRPVTPHYPYRPTEPNYTRQPAQPYYGHRPASRPNPVPKIGLSRPIPKNRPSIDGKPLLKPWSMTAPPAPNGDTFKRRRKVVQKGFRFCCGDGKYRIDIRCSDRTKRCYKKVLGRWKWTYGQACKAHSRVCFFSTCRQACR